MKNLSSCALICSAILLGTVVPASAAESEEAIQKVILSQILAFAEDDAEGAWQYASKNTQQRFGSPEVFLEAVRVTYPAVYRAGTVKFKRLTPHPGFAVQSLLIIGPQGQYWDSLYTMVVDDGSWRIEGVLLEEAGPGI